MSTTNPQITIDGLAVGDKIDLLEPDFNIILAKLKTIVLDGAVTVADFFDGNLYRVPTVEMNVKNCQNKLTSILNNLSNSTPGILAIINTNITNPTYMNTYKSIIFNFNQIKAVVSRLYVCSLVYENKHAVVTSDYGDKITELQKLIKETTQFLLKLDEISETDFASYKDEPTLALPPTTK